MTDEFDINWPHGHVTRDGRKARIILKEGFRGLYGETIVAVVTGDDGISRAIEILTNGRLLPHLDSYSDLLNAPAPPKQKTGRWVNFYAGGVAGYHETRADADYAAGNDRIGCVYVEFEEGEGL